MQAIASHSTQTWQIAPNPLVLTDVFLPEKHIAVWQRSRQQTISQYFEMAFNDLGLGLRSVYSMKTLKQVLTEKLPDGKGKCEAIEDIYLLSDMLTCLFDCQDVGLRLAPMSSAMCPRFHIDNIPVRLVCTYLGDGTQWLPDEVVNHSKLGHGANGLPDHESGLYCEPTAVQQLKAFDVALLKGSAWDDDVTKAVVHRSCPIENGQTRVLLTLDPM
ncbi:MAG: hypothetical protein ACI8WB_003672 [Phenylobacterium sp.]|jgi:hypothetical protein